LTFAQIAMEAANDPEIDVEPVGDGNLVNGEEYTPRDQPPGDNANL
jgi:hypothetical protein